MLIWPILKPLSLKKGKLALDSNIAMSVLFLSPSTLIGTSVIDCQLQCLKYSIKFPANFVESCLFKCSFNSPFIVILWYLNFQRD